MRAIWGLLVLGACSNGGGPDAPFTCMGMTGQEVCPDRKCPATFTMATSDWCSAIDAGSPLRRRVDFGSDCGGFEIAVLPGVDTEHAVYYRASDGAFVGTQFASRLGFTCVAAHPEHRQNQQAHRNHQSHRHRLHRRLLVCFDEDQCKSRGHPARPPGRPDGTAKYAKAGPRRC